MHLQVCNLIEWLAVHISDTFFSIQQIQATITCVDTTVRHHILNQQARIYIVCRHGWHILQGLDTLCHVAQGW